MKVKLWGVRGSIPTPPLSSHYLKKLKEVLALANGKDLSTPDKIDNFVFDLEPRLNSFVGGNTSTTEIQYKDKLFIIDLGSGLRELGNTLMKPDNKIFEIHIFISHTHWDHMYGFPFFKPAYDPRFTLHFYSPHGDLLNKLHYQQDFRFFPVSVDYMQSKKIFHEYNPESTLNFDGVEVSNIELYHPGKSYGYKFKTAENIFIFASDSEYNNFSSMQYYKYIEFYKNADVLIFDAQYSFDQELQRIDWGHSSALVGVDLAIKSNVKTLALYHHDPDNDDDIIYHLYENALIYKERNYPESKLNLILAKEGMVFDL